jgi:hypothetical protein
VLAQLACAPVRCLHLQLACVGVAANGDGHCKLRCEHRQRAQLACTAAVRDVCVLLLQLSYLLLQNSKRPLVRNKQVGKEASIPE